MTYMYTYEIIPQLNYFISLVSGWADGCLFLLWQRVISIERNWYSIYRTRQILPHLPIYEIRQRTRLHSRAPPRISHRIRLTFTSITKHTHAHTLICTILIISSADHLPWLSNQHQQTTAPIGSRQQQQAAAGSNNTNRQSAAGTVLLDITNCMNFWTFTHNISLPTATVVHLPCN